MVAVSVEPVAASRSAVAAAGFPFPLLSDPDLAVIDRYGVRDDREPERGPLARPALFVVGGDGVVRFAHVGEHPRDRPAVGAMLLAVETLE